MLCTASAPGATFTDMVVRATEGALPAQQDKFLALPTTAGVYHCGRDTTDGLARLSDDYGSFSLEVECAPDAASNPVVNGLPSAWPTCKSSNRTKLTPNPLL